MKSQGYFKKAQSLPLNTIVIAILVVIVLVIIIAFFATNFNQQNNTVDEVTSCSASNPTFSALGYGPGDIRPINEGSTTGQTCEGTHGSDYSPAVGVPNCCVRSSE